MKKITLMQYDFIENSDDGWSLFFTVLSDLDITKWSEDGDPILTEKGREIYGEIEAYEIEEITITVSETEA